MTNRKTKIILAILVPLFFLAAGLTIFLSNRVKMNPAGTVGNTAGNLNNGGYFVEYNGTVYFANAYDNGALYTMNLDESGIKKRGSVSVCNLLAGGSYLYYFQMGASGDAGLGFIRSAKTFNRCDLNGGNITGLLQDVVIDAQLVDNYLYMQVSQKGKLRFIKMKIDKSETVDLADYIINPACARDGVIYYNGTQEDHYLYALNTANDVASVVWRGNLWNPVLEDDFFYYLDVENDYRLCRYSLSRDTVEVLTNDRVDCFNVGSGYIYYQKNDSAAPQLRCMRTDGTGNTVIAEGIYTNICMSSQYVYFQEFGIDNACYHSWIGTADYSEFTAARDAALR